MTTMECIDCWGRGVVESPQPVRDRFVGGREIRMSTGSYLFKYEELIKRD